MRKVFCSRYHISSEASKMTRRKHMSMYESNNMGVIFFSYDDHNEELRPSSCLIALDARHP